jgi:isopenicillin N synthase-like dioxygenase
MSATPKQLLASLQAGCRDGFFYVANHGVPQTLIDAAFAASKAFFALPPAAKAALAATPSATSGYRASGSTCVGAKGQAAPESRELMRYAATDCDVSRCTISSSSDAWPLPARQLLAGPAAEGVPLWPAELSSDPQQQQQQQDEALVPAGYQATILSYFEAVNSLATQLMRGAATALGLPEDALLADDAAAAVPAWQTLSLMRYAALASVPEQGVFAAGAHKDRFCCLTVLANTPDSRGLEALTADGMWYEVPPKPGCFIVNVGSLLELWSGGRCPASVHRVVNYSSAERYSIAFFRGNAPSTLVRPLLPPVGCGSVRAGAGQSAAANSSSSSSSSAAAESAAVVAADCTTLYQPVLFGDYLKGFSAAMNKAAAAAAAPAAAVAQVAG